MAGSAAPPVPTPAPVPSEPVPTASHASTFGRRLIEDASYAREHLVFTHCSDRRCCPGSSVGCCSVPPVHAPSPVWAPGSR
ncbi:hypothetical protein DEJ30_13360 [Curtobacterium sp. MCPF17_003]|nr:hypothetical protein DEJ30_13360 [Curtobacterium sp. MCPF17_003]